MNLHIHQSTKNNSSTCSRKKSEGQVMFRTKDGVFVIHLKHLRKIPFEVRISYHHKDGYLKHHESRARYSLQKLSIKTSRVLFTGCFAKNSEVCALRLLQPLQILKSFKPDPPKNSRTMELAGIRLASNGKNHSRKASNLLASIYSGARYCTCLSKGSASGLSAESSYTNAELNITSAFS